MLHDLSDNFPFEQGAYDASSIFQSFLESFRTIGSGKGNMADEDYHKLSKQEISLSIQKLKDWKLIGKKIHREFTFATFEDAISFMLRSSLEIAKLDHHPEWQNVYNRVTIDLTTHDVGGLSQYDFILAQKLDEIGKLFRAK
jgi:4a-hydroxytetrahydrobiopterin dehydratase